MSDPADIQRLIGDLIRLGTIASVDLADATCRVEIGDLMTGDVPWLAFRAGGTAAWSPPTVGEQCLLLCPEGDTEAGVVLLGLYSTAHPAPATADRLDLIRYADGAIIGYDAAQHRLTATLPAGGTAAIAAPGGVSITGDVAISGKLSVTGNVDVSGKATVADDVIGGGISLKTHKHSGVSAGGAKTGVPE